MSQTVSSELIPPAHDNEKAQDLDGGEPGSNVSIVTVVPKLDNRPAAAGGKTLRLRGMSLPALGALFPNADFHIHRVNGGKEGDFETRGEVLCTVHDIIDLAAIFRVTMTRCDEPAESIIGWNKVFFAEAFTTQEFCNVLELGGEGLGKMMMLTVYTEMERAW